MSGPSTGETPLQGLVALAFASGPAHQANPLIEKVRQQIRAQQGRAFNYEVPLMGRSWEYLQQTVAPRLALYLRGKGLDIQGSECVFISLFQEQTLYFIRTCDFFAHLRQIEGLDEQTFISMVQGWARTGRRAKAALPTSSKKPN